jgi:hypothetical protein
VVAGEIVGTFHIDHGHKLRGSISRVRNLSQVSGSLATNADEGGKDAMRQSPPSRRLLRSLLKYLSQFSGPNEHQLLPPSDILIAAIRVLVEALDEVVEE